jgi:hypothetical protein
VPLILPDFTQKLSWAEHHLELLEAKAAAFAEAHPYEARRVDDGDVSSAWKLVFTAQPEATVSTQVGDVIQNMRATLDYLATALANAGPNRRAYFPLVDVPIWEIPWRKNEPTATTRARRYWNVATNGMPEGAVKIIQELQPIGPMWEGGGLHPYKLLVELSNVDRHRQLHLMVRGLTDLFSTVTLHDGQIVPNPVEPDVAPGREDGAALSSDANLVLPFGVEPATVASMQIRGTVTLAIQIDEKRYTVVPKRLREILEAMRREVITPLAPFVA